MNIYEEGLRKQYQTSLMGFATQRGVGLKKKNYGCICEGCQLLTKSCVFMPPHILGNIFRTQYCSLRV